MTIRHFYIFKTVCEELNFTRAAEKLYMTQPAVSHAIKEMEEETGTVLFERLSRKIYISRDGELLLKKVIRLLELYESMDKNGRREGEEPPFKLGSSITIANSWLPGVLRDLKDLPVQVEVDSAARTLEKLKRNQVDLAFVEGVVEGGGLVSIPFVSYRVAAVCSPEYEFLCKAASGMKLTPELFVQERLLLRERGSAIRDVLDSSLFLLGLSAAPYWESVNSQALLKAAERGLGIAVLPESILGEAFCGGRIQEIPIDGFVLKTQGSLVYHRDKFLTPQMRRLTERI